MSTEPAMNSTTTQALELAEMALRGDIPPNGSHVLILVSASALQTLVDAQRTEHQAGAAEPKALDWPKIEAFVDEYVEGYEMRGESEYGRDACYTPNENDRALLRDCIAGLLAEPEFLAALAADQKGAK